MSPNDPETAAAAPTIATRLASFAHGLRLEARPGRGARAGAPPDARRDRLRDGGARRAVRRPSRRRRRRSRRPGHGGRAASSASRRACRCATPRCSTACSCTASTTTTRTWRGSSISRSASCRRCSRSAASAARAAPTLLVAYIAALEAGARIASAAQGGFHAQGFHPTGVVGAFASSDRRRPHPRPRAARDRPGPGNRAVDGERQPAVPRGRRLDQADASGLGRAGGDQRRDLRSARHPGAARRLRRPLRPVSPLSRRRPRARRRLARHRRARADGRAQRRGS